MKFLHTGDLHIGKSLNNFSLIKDQEYILQRIVELAKEQKVDGVILAGDLYDRSVPPAEAVSLFSDFVTKLVDENIEIFAISGNHDSPERIGFAGGILQKKGFYIEGQLDSGLVKIEKQDEFGKLNIYMLPFVREAILKEFCKNNYGKEVRGTEDAIKTIIAHANIDTSERNILIAHYFVTSGGAFKTVDGENFEIEEKQLGTLGNVDASVFKDFDYVALGHIHGYIRVGNNKVYYSSSPLKYSFREINEKKGVIIVEFNDKKDEVKTEQIKVLPLHDMRKLTGTLEEIMSPEVQALGDVNDYIVAELTDEGDIYDPMGKLKSIYPNAMHLTYLRDVEASGEDREVEISRSNISPLEAYLDFCKYVGAEAPSEECMQVVNDVIKDME